MELNEYAEINKLNLQNEVTSLLSNDFSSANNYKFFTFCEINKKISINLSLESLKKVIDSGNYKNIFELRITSEEIKKKYSIRYYDKLISFVNDFDNKKKS